MSALGVRRTFLRFISLDVGSALPIAALVIQFTALEAHARIVIECECAASDRESQGGMKWTLKHSSFG
jgi:hypothetical protein